MNVRIDTDPFVVCVYEHSVGHFQKFLRVHKKIRSCQPHVLYVAADSGLAVSAQVSPI